MFNQHYKNRIEQYLRMTFLATGLSLLQPVLAGNANLRLVELNAEEIRQLRETGNIMPLESLLQTVRENYPGRVIEIELEVEDGHYVYELEIVDNNGIVWEYYFDARNGKLLERERED